MEKEPTISLFERWITNLRRATYYGLRYGVPIFGAVRYLGTNTSDPVDFAIKTAVLTGGIFLSAGLSFKLELEGFEPPRNNLFNHLNK